MKGRLEEVYTKIFGRDDASVEVNDNDSLVQPAWGKIVDSFTTSFLSGEAPLSAKLESDTKRD